MTSNHSLVFLVCVSLLFHSFIDSASKLKIFFSDNRSVIKCSDYGYLIIDDWFKFRSSNISCPNQTDLFADKSPYLYNQTSRHRDCHAKTRSMSYISYVSELNANNNLTEEQLRLLSNTVSVDNATYSFEAVKEKHSDRVLIHNIPFNWTFNFVTIFYTIFKEQPVGCFMRFNYSTIVKNETCLLGDAYSFWICYYEPSSEPSLKNIDWKTVVDLGYGRMNFPSNWRNNGGLYYDVRSKKTTITQQTTVSTTATTSEETRKTTTTDHSPSTVETSQEMKETTLVDQSTSTVITSTKMEETTLVTRSTSTVTTSKKMKKTTSTVHSMLKSSAKKIQKSQSTKNTSTVPKKSSPKKKAFSLSILLILLSIFAICCIIGMAFFFIFRFRRKQEDDDHPLLDRIDSDESNISKIDQLEISRDSEAEQLKKEKSRKGGRMRNQLDPDE